MSRSDLIDRLTEAAGLGRVESGELDAAIDLLLWFGVLGVQPGGQSEARYAYELQGDIARLKLPLDNGDALAVINPAFRSALLCREPD